VTSKEVETTTAPAAAPKKRTHGIPFKFLIPAILALDVLAVLLVPPFPKGGTAARRAASPSASSPAPSSSRRRR